MCMCKARGGGGGGGGVFFKLQGNWQLFCSMGVEGTGGEGGAGTDIYPTYLSNMGQLYHRLGFLVPDSVLTSSTLLFTQ